MSFRICRCVSIWLSVNLPFFKYLSVSAKPYTTSAMYLVPRTRYPLSTLRGAAVFCCSVTQWSYIMSRFYFGGSDNSSEPEDDNLPFPTPLPRSSFLTPDFSPITFLSELHNRHQTLEDLRSELRTRSQDLTKELLDLLNTNYQDFLNLGVSLRGGEEKVEEVRVGLLGFKKDLEGVKEVISKREEEMRSLLHEKRALRKQIWLGRNLLEFAGRLDDLEEKLLVGARAKGSGDGDEEDWAISDTDEDSDDETEQEQATGTRFMSMGRLQRRVQDYLYLKNLSSGLGPDHPYVSAQAPRISNVRQTLLLDLNTALKQAIASRPASNERVVKMMGLYGEMDEANEAVRTLRGSKIEARSRPG